MAASAAQNSPAQALSLWKTTAQAVVHTKIVDYLLISHETSGADPSPFPAGPAGSRPAGRHPSPRRPAPAVLPPPSAGPSPACWLAPAPCSASRTSGRSPCSAASTTPRSARACSSAAVSRRSTTGDAGWREAGGQVGPGVGQAAQLPEQVRTLPGQHLAERCRVTHLRHRHDLEEEVVPVAAGPRAGLGQPAPQLVPAGRSEPVHQPVRLDRLGLALGLDQAIPAQAFQQLIQVPDVQPAPLVAYRLVEAALELVAMGRLDGQQRQHGVMKSHVISLPSARPGTRLNT